ncbi:metaphase chromosome protein 1 [Fructobacillus sp. M1-13]|uniref:Metaphase chromosome protein 1 n=1 Tax=Fructobacillus papyriferae TaxID=2713171 RepID=A0ABS5QRH9_9LACO|nr:metaphase chromosome protein 1 [Fructobacillus papyriferae]MBS9335432.1 metaphase chromosome protein 1 [Fructobacillus papyriferae]MCD2158897.1 metaphase chromosome protein 1 [Fructobacillus papyriferae]
MKQGKSAQIKKFKKQKSLQKFQEKKKLSPFDYNEFAGFLRARFFLTKQHSYQKETFEVASFFLDDLIATMVQQNFSDFTSDKHVIVKMNEVMQATLVQSADRDWRYFITLMPVLYDIQSFLAKEASVSDRFSLQTTPFDPNFWRMIVRTVLAVNYFRFQGQDVAKVMSEGNAIDDLQFKFLNQNEQDDDFALATIEEVYKGLSVTEPKLSGKDVGPKADKLSAGAIEEEVAFGKRMVETFQKTAIKDVVSDQEVQMLLSFHKGLAEQYQVTHREWTNDLLTSFAKKHLMDYWQPKWDSLDGLGGEIARYVKFLDRKKAVDTVRIAELEGSGLDHFVDIQALNKLLGQLSDQRVEELLQEPKRAEK